VPDPLLAVAVLLSQRGMCPFPFDDPLGELEALARLTLPVTVVVFDDSALSLVKLKQRAGQGGARPCGSRRWAWPRSRPRWKPVGHGRRRGQRAGSAAPGGPWPVLRDDRTDATAYRHLIAARG
jgi:hypothetical protein